MEKAPNILILSEALELRFFLEAVLTEAHYRTTSAVNMEDALEQIVRNTPAMVLIDVMMSGRQGISMYRQLRRHEKYKFIPVIMLSTLARESFFQLHNIEYSLPQKGLPRPDGYLSKPPEAEELVEMIKKIFKDRSTLDNKGKRSCN